MYNVTRLTSIMKKGHDVSKSKTTEKISYLHVDCSWYIKFIMSATRPKRTKIGDF